MQKQYWQGMDVIVGVGRSLGKHSIVECNPRLSVTTQLL